MPASIRKKPGVSMKDFSAVAKIATEILGSISRISLADLANLELSVTMKPISFAEHTHRSDVPVLVLVCSVCNYQSIEIYL